MLVILHSQEHFTKVFGNAFKHHQVNYRSMCTGALKATQVQTDSLLQCLLGDLSIWGVCLCVLSPRHEACACLLTLPLSTLHVSCVSFHQFWWKPVRGTGSGPVQYQVDLLLLMSLKSSYSRIELRCCLVSIFLPSLAFHRRVESPSLCRHLITCIGNSEQHLLCDHTTQYAVRMKTNTLSWTQRNSKKICTSSCL